VAVASLADLEARVAALEADRADYRAVLAAVGALAGRVSDAEVKIDAHREAINALGEKVAGFQAEVRERFDTLDRNREEDRGEAAAFRRSVEDGQDELKDLVLQALDRRRGQ
jgi:DNA repair ATPase RecN